MMNETVQHGCVQDAMPDSNVMKNFTEDDRKGMIGKREIARLQAIHSRKQQRDPKQKKQSVRGSISRRWLRRMDLDETCRAPSLFTWRC